MNVWDRQPIKNNGSEQIPVHSLSIDFSQAGKPPFLIGKMVH